MKKYTKKQIEKAFLRWETEYRLNPSSMMSDEQVKKLSVEEHAKESMRTLIEFME